jgi:hypothetical protein
MGLKCGLVFFTGAEQDLMEVSSKIKSRKPTGTCKFIHQLIKDWYRKLAFSSDGIKLSKIHTKAIGAVFLFDQQNR